MVINMFLFLFVLGSALVIALGWSWNRIRLETVSPIRYAAKKLITNQPIVIRTERKITAHTPRGTVSIYYDKDSTSSRFDKLRVVAESERKRYVKEYYLDMLLPDELSDRYVQSVMVFLGVDEVKSTVGYIHEVFE